MSENDQKTLKSGFHVIRIEALCRRLSLSRSWIYQQIALDNFPRPIALGSRAVGWLESEIDAWVEQRVIASRDQDGAE